MEVTVGLDSDGGRRGEGRGDLTSKGGDQRDDHDRGETSHTPERIPRAAAEQRSKDRSLPEPPTLGLGRNGAQTDVSLTGRAGEASSSSANSAPSRRNTGSGPPETIGASSGARFISS